ncbi:MAG TPA: MauE/DoxX family redox-associated membrane protein [Pyrinomonadaceae bacterium]
MLSATQHQLLALFATTFVALIFIASGGAKLLRPRLFVDAVRDFKIVPDSASKPVAYLLPYLETCVGLFLLLDQYRPIFLTVAVIMLAAFTLAITVNLARGRTLISCGCFGSHEKTELTWLLVARNLLFVAVAIVGLIHGGSFTNVALAERVVVILSTGALITSYYLSALIVRFRQLEF